jgi:uncharacterized protein with FMN-binding domain
MKRALLIAGGTVGGLGAVLSITPPQLNSQSAMGGLSNIASAAVHSAAPVAHTTTAAPAPTTPVSPATPVATTPSATPTAIATVVKKKKVIKKKVAVAKRTVKKTSARSTPTTAATTLAVPTPVATTPAPATPTASTATKKVSGTFIGNVVYVNYGNVQVQITMVNGKITDAQALQAPSGRSDRYTQYALPILRSQTLALQAPISQTSSIQGASGASYTSWGWLTSLQAALAKAGL